MHFQSFFKSLTSTSTRWRPARRRVPASQQCVEVLEDRRLLTFLTATTYTAGTSPQAVVTADFNGDGQLDLGVASNGSNTVSVLLGNGDGTFQAALTSDTGSGPESILAADLNGDGDIDLVTVNNNYDHGTGDLSVLLGNGDGTFQMPQSVVLPSVLSPSNAGSYLLGQTVSTVKIRDLNADGRFDLIARGSVSYYADVGYVDEYGYPIYEFRYDAYVNVLLGNGDATFDSGTAYYLSNPSGGLKVGDFNGDGRTDVGTDWQVLLNNGDGTLQNPVSFYGADAFAKPAGDVNADGKQDIVIAGRITQVNLGHGDGSFALPLSSDLGTPLDNYYFSSSALGDFDGDGLLDLVGTAPDIHYYDEYENEVYFPGFVAVSLNDGNWTPLPTVTIGDVTVTEGNVGAQTASFIVTLSKIWDHPVTVSYSIGSGSALVGDDYQDAFGTLMIPAGQTSGTISVLVNGDRLYESNETFVVNLDYPINATISDGLAVGTILNDEPQISISDVSNRVGHKKQTIQFIFTVTLSAAYDQAVTMSYRTVNGTAKASKGDYIAKTGTLTFNPGETTKTITIAVRGGSKREANEEFFLDLFGNSGNSLLAKARGMGRILNDR